MYQDFQILTLKLNFWVNLGVKTGSKWVKTCPSPYKTRYKCHLQGISHVRGGEDVKVTRFDISPKFTLFWGHKGAKLGGQNG